MIEFSPGPVEYRALESGGFELLRSFWVRSPLLRGVSARLPSGRAEIRDEGKTGISIVHAGFRCDGASIPDLVPDWILDADDPRWVRAFFQHDAHYKHCRKGLVPQWSAFRGRADEVMRLALLHDGMPGWKARLAHWGVRVGGAGSAEPQPDPEEQVLRVP